MNNNNTIIEVVIEEETNRIEPYKQRILKLINEELYGGTKIRLTTSLEIVSTRCELIQWINDNVRIFFKISHPILQKMVLELYQKSGDNSQT
jgi:hypothetical protein